MKTFLIKYGHEAAMVLLAIWAAIGTSGQTGLINLLTTEIAKHPGWSMLGVLINVWIASRRVPPSQRAPQSAV